MAVSKIVNKKGDRRVAFRIYEQVNLFYQKIDRTRIQETESAAERGLTDFPLSQSIQSKMPLSGKMAERTLPHSESRENDTLDVNISTSGIAFTTKEALEPGDFLIIRLFLLSGKTVLVTCCKVIYCKPSNPYENDRYPFSIGAHFINLTEQDRDLLNRYVGKQKRRQWLLNGLLLSFLIAWLAVPDVMFDLCVDFFAWLLDHVLTVLSTAFDYATVGLDLMIEYFFKTERHATQVIEFYTTAALGLIFFYLLWRRLPSLCRRSATRLGTFWFRKKSSFLYVWGEQSVSDKAKIIGGAILAVTCYGYLMI